MNTTIDKVRIQVIKDVDLGYDLLIIYRLSIKYSNRSISTHIVRVTEARKLIYDTSHTLAHRSDPCTLYLSLYSNADKGSVGFCWLPIHNILRALEQTSALISRLNGTFKDDYSNGRTREVSLAASSEGKPSSHVPGCYIKDLK